MSQNAATRKIRLGVSAAMKGGQALIMPRLENRPLSKTELKLLDEFRQEQAGTQDALEPQRG